MAHSSFSVREREYFFPLSQNDAACGRIRIRMCRVAFTCVVFGRSSRFARSVFSCVQVQVRALQTNRINMKQRPNKQTPPPPLGRKNRANIYEHSAQQWSYRNRTNKNRSCCDVVSLTFHTLFPNYFHIDRDVPASSIPDTLSLSLSIYFSPTRKIIEWKWQHF